MKSASTESQMEAMLENLPPDVGPRLEQQLSSAPWTPRGVKRRRVFIGIYLSIILLVALVGLTPQGRAFAQNIFKFFTTTDQSSFPLSEEEINDLYAPIPTYALSLVEVTPLPPQPDDCPNPDGTETYECEIKQAENELNMDLKEFSEPPPIWKFVEVQALSNTSSSLTNDIGEITYATSSGYLILRQGNGDFPPDRVLSSAIEQVKIGEYYGEYVDGLFGVRNGDTNLSWDAVGADQRIRWREGERWFEIFASVGPGTSGYLDKQALISLASSMVYQPENREETAQVDFDFIPNIPLAEKICVCDILQPGKLPNDNTHFDYVRYDPERKSITLHYGYRALRIVQTPLESAIIRDLDSYKNVDTVRVGDAVGQFGISPAQKTIWESATPPVFTTNNSYSVLLWKKDGMMYQIYFDQSFSGGGQLTKEQMIEIGESLR